MEIVNLALFTKNKYNEFIGGNYFMKITMNTKREDVKKKTKETLAYLVNLEENRNIALEEDLAIQLLKIQKLIKQERSINLTLDELLYFLKNSMNYGAFQFEMQEMLSFQEQLRLFLKDKSITDLLNLFDIYTNFNQKNIEDIDNQIENSSFMMFYKMMTRESVDDTRTNITAESRKIVVTTLIK